MHVDTHYDYAGRTKEVSEPAYLGDPQYWNQTLYDELGRTIAVRAANGVPSTVLC